MNLPQQSIYEFGEYRIETGERLLRCSEQIVSLPPKAIELLFVLLESGGRVLTKEALMTQVWADAFVEEGNLSHNVFLLRKALRDGKKFIETIPRRGYRFSASVRKIVADSPVLISREQKTTRILIEEEIESPNDWLIGRRREISVIKNLLHRADTRLLTLTGVGGAGKTSLARAVLQEISEEFSGGAAFVDLSAIRDSSLVLPSIAQALEIKESNNESVFEQLKTFLGNREFLLVLDNFEQVMNAAPQVAQLTSDASKILITSRSRLHLSCEHEFQVPPLNLPLKEKLPEELIEYASVRLFVERAQTAKSLFKLTDENALTIAEICRRLEGLPLAIELAAARTRLMSPSMILERLENQLKFLSGGGRDLPFRQQTMRAAIAWSYDLLNAEEKCVFERLSVFAGGFTLAAAEAICELEDELEAEVLDIVGVLLDNNLVVQNVETADGESRFRFLEVIGEFASERLAENDKAEKIESRHAEYFLAQARNYSPISCLQTSSEWFAFAKNEQDNMRKSFSFWLTHNAEYGLELAVMLHLFWSIINNFAECRTALTEALKKTSDEPSFLRGSGFKAAGMIAWKQGDYESAHEFYIKNMEIAEAIGNEYLAATAGNGLGIVAYLRNELDAARSYFEAALARSRALGLENLNYSILTGLAEVFRLEGDYTAARLLNEEALEIVKIIGNTDSLIGSCINIGILSYLEGDYRAAESYLKKSLEMSRDGNKTFVSVCLDGFAALVLQKCDSKSAAKLAAAAQKIRDEIGYTLEMPDRIFREEYLALLYEEFDAETFALLTEEGREMSASEAVALAFETFKP